ncbi:MAG: ribosome small subunit-dependent GTPase A [Acidobacteriota bacterium]|nr:ribosome small subunit-dependent GTPase A [Acidobacteriota bacterium]
MNLSVLGFNAYWENFCNEHQISIQFLARIGAVHADGPTLLTAKGHSLRAHPPGEPCAVGDWVVWAPIAGDRQRVAVARILDRRTRMARKAAGRTSEHQVLAANIDTVLIVSTLDVELKPARLERYLAMVWESGAKPVFVLTKLDACPDPEPYLEAVAGVAFSLPVFPVSALTGQGIDELAAQIGEGVTAVLVGSSGVGKSTLVNCLLGSERQRTGGVREHDRRGRHTTTHRELIPLGSGGVLIDTPGLRELQLQGESEALDKAFSDIEEFALSCRFRDCGHQGEPGCAVEAAVVEGSLARRRLLNYHKLQREISHQADREKAGSRRQRKKDRALHRMYKEAQSIKRKQRGY